MRTATVDVIGTDGSPMRFVLKAELPERTTGQVMDGVVRILVEERDVVKAMRRWTECLLAWTVIEPRRYWEGVLPNWSDLTLRMKVSELYPFHDYVPERHRAAISELVDEYQRAQQAGQ